MQKPFLAVLGALWLLAGCGLCGKVAGTTESRAETIKIIEHSELVPVITTIHIPDLLAERETRDTSSHLENKYAESDACVRRDGSLYHNLRTKPQDITQKQEVKIEYRDSIVTQHEYKETIRETKVEKELTAWQKFRLRGFWVMLAIAAFAYRGQIIALIKKIISLIV